MMAPVAEKEEEVKLDEVEVKQPDDVQPGLEDDL